MKHKEELDLIIEDLYATYCQGKGLRDAPTWEEFSTDSTKTTQTETIKMLAEAFLGSRFNKRQINDRQN